MTETKNRKNKSAEIETTKYDDAKPRTGRPKSKESSNAASSFFTSSTVSVIALVTLFVAVFAGVRLFSVNRNHAQFTFVENAGFDQPETSNAGFSNIASPEIFRGEVYDTTVRLRETGAIGMAISLTVFAEFSEKKNIPANFETILNAAAQRDLMPPGTTFENGKLESASSVFFIRYQSQPLAFEILSSPKQKANGKSPSLMMRFPLTSLDKRTITYFQSSVTNQFQIPEPFAPLDRIVAVGWTIEQWRGELLPKTENAQQLLDEEKKYLSDAAMNR